MILLHLSINDKPAILDQENILFAEELEIDKDDEKLRFTRVYLKQPIPGGDGEITAIDIRESVEKLCKLFK